MNLLDWVRGTTVALGAVIWRGSETEQKFLIVMVGET